MLNNKQKKNWEKEEWNSVNFYYTNRYSIPCRSEGQSPCSEKEEE